MYTSEITALRNEGLLRSVTGRRSRIRRTPIQRSGPAKSERQGQGPGKGFRRRHPPGQGPVGKVYTSKYNRAYETAVLAGFKDIEKTAIA